MKVLAIDPGNVYSGFVIVDADGNIIEKGKLKNEKLLRLWCVRDQADYLAIEMIASYGMPVGKEVFDTCVWIGRFIQQYGEDQSYRLYRKSENKEFGIESIFMHLCKTNRAKDSNVRQALLDRYSATGGGKTPQVGIKSSPGPLYGVTCDMWSALAVGVTFIDWYKQQRYQFENGV